MNILFLNSKDTQHNGMVIIQCMRLGIININEVPSIYICSTLSNWNIQKLIKVKLKITCVINNKRYLKIFYGAASKCL